MSGRHNARRLVLALLVGSTDGRAGAVLSRASQWFAVVTGTRTILLALVFATMESDAEAYSTALACVGAGADPACVLSRSATVPSRGETSGKGNDYEAELQRPGSGGPVLTDLTGGTRGVWRLLRGPPPPR